MSGNADSLSVLLSSLASLAGSGVLAGFFTVSIALLLFCAFVNVVAYSVYLAIVLWTAYERDKNTKSSERGEEGGVKSTKSEPEFDFGAVRTAIGLVIAQAAAVLGQFGAILLSVAARGATLLLNNITAFVLLMLLFILIAVWGPTHDIIYRAGAQFFNGVVFPVARPTVVAIANTGSLIVGAALPVSNFLRQMQVSVVSETLIDALVCGRSQISVVATNGGVVLREFGNATADWLVASNTLDISPNYTATGLALGRTLASLDTFGRCMCDEAAEVAVEPFANVARRPEFARAFDSAINTPLSFVTRTVIGTIVRSFERGAVQRPPIDPPFEFASGFLDNSSRVGDALLNAVGQVAHAATGLAIGECEIQNGVGVFCTPQYALIGVIGLPPVPGLINGLTTLALDAPIVQLFHYLGRIITNPDRVFFTLEGVQFFNIESTIGAAFLRGLRSALDGTWGWFKALLDSIATFLDTMPLLQGRPGDSPAALELALSDAERSALNRRFATEATLITSSLRLVGTIFDTIRELVLRTGEAVHDAVSLAVDFPFGTIYGAVETGGDPLFFAKSLFDNVEFGETPECRLPTRTGLAPMTRDETVPFLFSLRFVSAPSTCPTHAEFREYCRFVFRQLVALGAEPNGTAVVDALVPQPPSMALVAFSESPTTVQANARQCALRVPGCTPRLFFLIPARLERVLQRFVRIPAALDIAIAGGVAGVPELRDFFAELTAPAVPLVLFFTEPVAHLRELLTTRYAACLDVEGAVLAVEEFVRALTNVMRAIEDATPNAQRCDVAFGASDARIFCAIPQAIDSFVGAVGEIGLLVWRTLVTLLRLADNSRTVASLRSALDLTRLEGLVRDAAFGVVSVVGQLIPAQISCSGVDLARSGCCGLFASAPNGEFDTRIACFSRQRPGDSVSCINHARSVFPRGFGEFQPLSAIVLNGTTISPELEDFLTEIGLGEFIMELEMFLPDANGNCPLNCGNDTLLLSRPHNRTFARPFDAEIGCCAEFAPGLMDTPGAKARTCLERANRLECRSAGTNIFVPGQTCAQAFDNECPPDPLVKDARTIAVDSVALILERAVFLFIRIPLGFATQLVDIVVAATQNPLSLLDERSFEKLFESVIGPFVELGVDILVQIARLFECLGAFDIFDLLMLIADLFDRIAVKAIDTLADLIIIVITFIAGVIELIFDQTFTLLQRALREILEFFVNIAIAIFGEGFICGLQETVCGAVKFVDFFGAGIAINSVMFAGVQCRAYDCCLLGLEPDEGSIPSCTDVDDDDDVEINVGLTGVPTNCSDPTLDCSFYCDEGVDCATDGQRRRKRGSLMSPMLSASEFFAQTQHLIAKRQAAPEKLEAMVGKGEDAAFYASLGRFGARSVHLWSHLSASTSRHWLEMAQEVHVAFDEYRDAKQQRGARAAQLETLLHPSSAHYRKRSVSNNWRSQYTGMAERTDTHHSTGRTIIVRWMLALRVAAHIYLESPEPRDLVVRAAAVINPVRLLSRGEDLATHSMMDRRRGVRFGAAGQAALEEHRNRVAVSKPITPLHFVRARAVSARVSQLGAHLWRAAVRRYETPVPQRHLQRKNQVASHSLILHSSSSGGGSFGALNVDAISDLIALPVCDNSTQRCTNCLVVDNLVFAATNGSRGVREFYPNRANGFLSYVARYEEILETTLVNAAGTDTFLTPNKRVPWIGLRLLNVHWVWDWDFTEFRDIFTGGTPAPPLGATFEEIQRSHQAIVGRPDPELELHEMFREPLRPAFGVLERVVAALQQLDGSGAALGRLLQRYVLCDYTGALQCRGSLGIGLFDAYANVLLLFIVPSALLGAVLPAAAAAFVPGPFSGWGLMLSYYLTLWIAYGASPLCTLASFLVGLVGVPTCLPIDVTTLISETLPQCAHVPISLIDPSELARAGRTLCSSVDVPLLQNCYPAAGFVSGFDNLFYTLQAVFGPEANEAIADLTRTAVPPLSELASLYTPAYVAQLGDLGAACNIMTFVKIAILPLLLALFTVGAFLIASGAISVASFVAGLFYATFNAVATMFGQINTVFIKSVAVRRLRINQ